MLVTFCRGLDNVTALASQVSKSRAAFEALHVVRCIILPVTLLEA